MIYTKFKRNMIYIGVSHVQFSRQPIKCCHLGSYTNFPIGFDKNLYESKEKKLLHDFQGKKK